MKTIEALIILIQTIRYWLIFWRKEEIKNDADESLKKGDQRKIEENHGGSSTDLPDIDGMYKRPRKKSQ